MEWSKIIQLPTRGIRAKQNKLDQCLATDQSNIRVVLVLTTQTVVSFCPIRGEEGCFLYGVFNGFDGSRVSSFVSQCLTAELLLGQLKSTHTDSDVRRILSQAFDVVEKSYFETIGDALAEKATIISQLPEGVSFHQLSPQSQKLSERLKDLEQEVSGGATAVVALIHNNKLYIANVGTNRALLCKSTSDGQNQVIQIGRPHTTENEDELQRLAGLGLDVSGLRQAALIAGQSSTRRIGDYRVKYNYTDIDLLSAAKNKPIIAEPEIQASQSLEGVTGFLLLMSEGLIKALESAHGPEQANQEMVAMVAAELAQQGSLEAVSQSVVERVKRLHHDVYASGRQRASHCSRHEDMTLLIRTLNYTLADGALTPTQARVPPPRSIPPITRPPRAPARLQETEAASSDSVAARRCSQTRPDGSLPMLTSPSSTGCGGRTTETSWGHRGPQLGWGLSDGGGQDLG
uniref:TGF-beta-activated kinase 1 and MAP3K7-binding protein 1-like isoform X1 n=1 Tax=Oncorhynchus gorbuscha TaxID=8017 RepID=UPI001EAF0E71|nr:TGF-beta-activated kinase 1 and MAP3K7-binding protein 1-like isoform X1 [Oncorhynchus gorbuscha]